jgi:hypothetical protein
VKDGTVLHGVLSTAPAGAGPVGEHLAGGYREVALHRRSYENEASL